VYLRGGVVHLPIIIKAKNNQSPNEIIRQFKKVVAATDIVQKVKDRRYYQKPSKLKAVMKEELKKQKKRARASKRMKNPPVRKISTKPRNFSSSNFSN